MSPEIYTMLGGFVTMVGGFVSLGLFMWKVMWRVTDRLDRKIDGLAKEQQAFARELSELRGEIRGRFGKPEIQPAE